MCGRYSYKDNLTGIIPFHYDLAAEIPSRRFNFAPSQLGPVLRLEESETGYVLDALKWGFIPAWAKDASRSPANARGETVATNGMFRSAFHKHRCLAFADGFFEWQTIGKSKLPWRFTLEDDSTFAFGSICSLTPDQKTFCLITTTPNEVVAKIHDRMPVIIPREHWLAWLDPATPVAEALQFVIPYTERPMKSYRVTSKMNASRYEAKDAIEPVDPDKFVLE